MKIKMTVTSFLVATTACGCMNLATKPSEITGSYTSDMKYARNSCDELGIEINSLARREDQLTTAQEQRRKSSKVQAFWVGYGNGDGIEASELANVRGEKEAVRRAFDKQRCETGREATRAVVSSGVVGRTGSGSVVTQTQTTGASWRDWAGQNGEPKKKPLYLCSKGDGTEVVSAEPAVGCRVIPAH